MKLLQAAAGLLGLAVVVVAWVAQCSGPLPIVEAQEMEEPEQPGDPYRVVAVVRNAGPGHGEIRVTFRLRDAGSGAAYAEERTIELERGDTIRVVAELHAPPRAYQAEVDAAYPVR